MIHDVSSISMIDGDVVVLLEAVPEFADRYLELVAAADGDPGAAVALSELADYVGGLVAEVERYRPVLDRCLEAVESVAARSDDSAELVAWAFLDSLAPEERRRMTGWFGPRTRALLEEVDPKPDPRPPAVER
jgi:hypothetical protein